MLGQQLAELVVRRIESVQRERGRAPADVTFAEAGLQAPSDGEWLLLLTLSETRCNVSGNLLLKISAAWMNRLLQALAPKPRALETKTKDGHEAVSGPPAADFAGPHAGKGSVARDTARSTPGGRLPISVGDADVLIGDSRLFTASVAEHHGKLCLTSLADVD